MFATWNRPIRALGRGGCAAIVAGLLTITPALAQVARTVAPTPQQREALRDFQARYGKAWTVTWSQDTEFAQLIMGSHIPSPQRLDSVEDFIGRARELFDENYDLFGVDGDSLQVSFADRTPAPGKVLVRFQQVVGGLRVWAGFGYVLFRDNGDATAIYNQAIPRTGMIPLRPELDDRAALALAEAAFSQKTGGLPERVTQNELILYPTGDKNQPARLAYMIEMRGPAAGAPLQWMFFVAADTYGGEILGEEDTIRHTDLTGNVTGMSSPGFLPDVSYNPPVPQVLSDMTVESPGIGTANTDLNGDFTIPFSGTTPQTVQGMMVGPWVRVMNSAGTELAWSATVTPGTPAAIEVNPAPAQFLTAQVNGFFKHNYLRNFIKQIPGSTFTGMDSFWTQNVNINSSCNAFYDGVSTNFYRAAGGCPNTAYDNVVYHETGHWLRDLTAFGASGGMHEGTADTTSVIASFTPWIGPDFFGPGTFIRDASAFSCFPNPGGSHDQGEPLMQSQYYVRQNLEAKYGTAAGYTLAQQLWLTWLEMGFTQLGPTSSILPYLQIDDDDGNIWNGTPNFAEIDSAHRSHCFYGPRLEVVHAVPQALLADTIDETGPYTLTVDGSTDVGTSIVSMDLFYSTDEGQTFTQVAMSSVGANSFQGSVPGLTSPQNVQWYVQATDDTGATGTYPSFAPDAGLASFNVGVMRTVFFDDFEADQGWTHTAGTGVDDWERAAPAGTFPPDPVAANSGTQALGNDLTSDGLYPADAFNNRALSPAIDFTGVTGARLRFARWLTSDDRNKVSAWPLANLQKVWSNPNTPGDFVEDTQWTPVDYSIGQHVDGNPNATVGFQLRSGSLYASQGQQLGGWTVDDVHVYSVEAVGSCVGTPTYGSGLAGTGGFVPALAGNGMPQIGNFGYALDVTNGLGGATGFLLLSNGPASLPLAGGVVYVDPAGLVPVPLTLGGTPGVGGAGTGSIPLPLPPSPSLLGLSLYSQALLFDAGASGGVSMSNGAQTIICQ